MKFSEMSATMFSFDCLVTLRNPLELCFRLKYPPLVKYSLGMLCHWIVLSRPIGLFCCNTVDPETSRSLINSLAASVSL